MKLKHLREQTSRFVFDIEQHWRGHLLFSITVKNDLQMFPSFEHSITVPELIALKDLIEEFLEDGVS